MCFLITGLTSTDTESWWMVNVFRQCFPIQRNSCCELCTWWETFLFMKINIFLHEKKYLFSWKEIRDSAVTVTYPDCTRYFLSILTEFAGGCCFCLLERQTQVDTLCWNDGYLVLPGTRWPIMCHASCLPLYSLILRGGNKKRCVGSLSNTPCFS